MTTNEILELVRAGYTKQDIEALEAVPAPAAPVSAVPAPVSAVPAPAAPIQELPVSAAPTAPDMSSGEKAILTALAELRAAYQAENRANAYLNGAPNMTPEEALAAGTFGNKF